jgi:hypothetical protein
MAAELVATGWGWAVIALIWTSGFLLGLSMGLRWPDASK